MCNPWELNSYKKNQKRADLEKRLDDLKSWELSDRAVYAEHSYKRDEIERIERELRIMDRT